jgi:Holliday junction resolvase
VSARGLQRERAVRDWLRDRDWVVTRAAGSLGDYDLHASKSGEATRLIEVKSTARGPYHGFSPADRQKLGVLAEWAGAQAWLAWWPPHGALHWIAETEWPASSIPGEETDGRGTGTG